MRCDANVMQEINVLHLDFAVRSFIIKPLEVDFIDS